MSGATSFQNENPKKLVNLKTHYDELEFSSSKKYIYPNCSVKWDRSIHNPLTMTTV